MTCHVCSPMPPRKYGDSSGRTVDDLLARPIHHARSVAAALIRAEAAEMRVRQLRGVQSPWADLERGIIARMPGAGLQSIIDELDIIAAALEAPKPPSIFVIAGPESEMRDGT